MKKTLLVQVKNPMETLMRITTMLQRRGCELQGIIYHAGKESSFNLQLTVGADSEDLMNNVVLQMKRFQDVFDVAEESTLVRERM